MDQCVPQFEDNDNNDVVVVKKNQVISDQGMVFYLDEQEEDYEKVEKIIDRILTDGNIITNSRFCSSIKLKTSRKMTNEQIIKCVNILMPLSTNTFQYLIRNNCVVIDFEHTKDNVDNLFEFIFQIFEYKNDFFECF